MAVKIKLKRMGKIRAPYYRIIVADARTKRDGRAIEEIGKYHPKEEPSFIEVDSDRAQHWLSVGAQPTEPVRRLLEITGDWQKYKGLPGAEGTLRSPAPRADKQEAFAAALAETLKGTDAKADKGAKAGRGGRKSGADTGQSQSKGKSPRTQAKAASAADAGAADTSADTGEGTRSGPDSAAERGSEA